MEAKAPIKGAPVAAKKYSLQVGAMVMQQNADALKQKLDASGFPATVRKGTASVKMEAVTVGELASKSEAEELARRLNVDGFPSQLVAVGSKYTPQVGAFFDENEAIDLARDLQKKNYSPKITVKPAKTTVFQVRHGQFDSRAVAAKRGEELKRKGFNYMVVHE
jgi:cell division septation protein DedD